MAVRTIQWRRGEVVLIDQRRLPGKEEYRVCRNYRQVAQAIRAMVVRGAPAIGVTAAMGVALGARGVRTRERLGPVMEQVFRTLEDTRPTAVNLHWALARMRQVYEANRDGALETLKRRLEQAALEMHEEDVAANRRLGDLGAGLLKGSRRILTHCNAGALATAGYGTALGVLRAMKESGEAIEEVFVDETRPFLQGSRLTAWELRKEKMPVTLITDNMAGYVMQRGSVDAVVVGADRVAANGDVANKIGTYTVAVLARRHGVPFYVACPTSTVDLACPSGADIPIEQRSSDEVTHVAGRRVAPEGVNILNPAFDVTDHRLVSAIITEKAVVTAPYRKNLRAVCGEGAAGVLP